jgi:peptide/nickel transport system substrate-binding protein
MRRAGFPSGRYSGPPLLMVGESRPPGSDTAKAVQRQLERLGFRFELRQATRTGSFNELCGVAAARVAVCANGEWAKDFFDPESVLDPVFNGERIVPAGSLNWSQVDDPELNAALEIAASETDPQTRAKAYAEIDRTVTGRAYVVPWLWDNQINSVSANVKGVVNRFNASWDMAYLSLR